MEGVNPTQEALNKMIYLEQQMIESANDFNKIAEAANNHRDVLIKTPCDNDNIAVAYQEHADELLRFFSDVKLARKALDERIAKLAPIVPSEPVSNANGTIKMNT